MSLSLTLRERFLGKGYTVAENGCWIWNGRIHPNGYGALSRHIKAHRASYEVFKGPIPAGLCVLHTCDNPPCVNPLHLFAGTRSDNMQDCSAKGRLKIVHKRGEENQQAKLTNEQAAEIILNDLKEESLSNGACKIKLLEVAAERDRLAEIVAKLPIVGFNSTREAAKKARNEK